MSRLEPVMPRRVKVTDYIYPYPFRSKIKEFQKRYPDVPYEEIPKDPRVQPRDKKQSLMKPYYSPRMGSWEIDIVFNVRRPRDISLFCININTRYLIVERLRDRSDDSIQIALAKLYAQIDLMLWSLKH